MKRDSHWQAGALFALLGWASCSGTAERVPQNRLPEASRGVDDAGTRAPDSAPPVDEASARAILFDAFSARGFQIRFDVPRALVEDLTITVDGYDPECHVGYEYVALQEEGLEVTAAVRAMWAKIDPPLLLVGPANPATLRRAITAYFSAENAPSDCRKKNDE